MSAAPPEIGAVLVLPPSVRVERIDAGRCDPWLLSEGQRPAHEARVRYQFTRNDDGGWESRRRCWRHRPEWAR